MEPRGNLEDTFPLINFPKSLMETLAFISQGMRHSFPWLYSYEYTLNGCVHMYAHVHSCYM